MRIEVLVNNDEPEIYPLNKSEIFIGSGDSSDIIISQHGVSRRHVKISILNEQYFVTDQGSTNGTFINEERLIPGRRSEFTSFFPVRLGDNVLLSLLSDEESESELLREFIKKDPSEAKIEASSDFQEPTRVISLNDLKKAKTQDLVKKRKTVIAKKQKQIAKKTKTSNKMLAPSLFCLIILGVGYYLNEMRQEDIETEITDAPEVVVPAEVAQNKITRPVLPDEIPKEKLNSYFYDLKCTTPEELEFCDSYAGFKKYQNGVIRVGTSFIVMVEETEWLDKSLGRLPGRLDASFLQDLREVDEEKNEVRLSDVYSIAFLEFLTTSKINMSKYVDTPFYFVFYKSNPNNGPVIDKVISMNSNDQQALLDLYNANTLRVIKRYGVKSVSELGRNFKIY